MNRAQMTEMEQVEKGERELGKGKERKGGVKRAVHGWTADEWTADSSNDGSAEENQKQRGLSKGKDKKNVYGEKVKVERVGGMPWIVL